MRASRRAALAASLLVGLGALCGATGCSGENMDTLLTLSVLTPDTLDPFEGAESVTLIVDANPREELELEKSEKDGYTTFSTDFSLEQATDMKGRQGPITLLVKDADKRVIARGRTPVVPLAAQSEPVVIWVNRVGQSAEVPARSGAATRLKSPRYDATAAVYDPLGAFILGGRDSTGDVTIEGQLYSAYYHRVEADPQPDLRQARALAGAARTEDGRLLVVGGERGEEDDPSPSFNAELLTPLADTGGAQFYLADPQTDLEEAVYKRAGAGFGSNSKGEIVVVGGRDESDVLRREVLRVTAVPLEDGDAATDAKVKVDSPATLSVERKRPAVVWLDSGKVLVLGGAADEKAAPGERVDLGDDSQREAITGPPLPFEGVVATEAGDGAVVLAGWVDGDGQPTRQVGLVNRTTLTLLLDVLTVARSGPTLTAFQLEDGTRRVLVAGGLDADGNPVGTAELLEVDDNGEDVRLVGEPIDLVQARARHVAALLPSGDIMLAGGLADDDQPTDSIELYTPCTAPKPDC